MASSQVTYLVFEVLTGSAISAATAVSLTASVLWIQSGVSGVQNVVMLRSTVVSAEWTVSGGTSHTYSWTFGGVSNQAGFVSTATTSAVTRTYSTVTGNEAQRQVSTTVSATVSAQASLITSAMALHIAAVAVPNYFDGIVIGETQSRRRTWPI